MKTNQIKTEEQVILLLFIFVTYQVLTISLLELKFVLLCVFISGIYRAVYLHILYVWYLNSLQTFTSTGT
jgi:hypothetical protein